MRASPEEFKNGIDCPAPLQIGPIKWKVGECFGGSGNNDKLRQLKKELAQAGLDDPKKLAENEYWLKRYGRKRWYPKYINQSGAKNQQGLLRGLAAWSGYDPLNEERGKTWIEADYGKPLVEGKKDYRLPGLLTKEQMQIELDSGKLPKPGFWIGEKGFEKSQWAQGYRYRMRASPEEFKNGIDCPAPLQIGPIKWKVGECFGGSGNNDKLRQLKKELAQAGLDDPKKLAENEYWLKRYGRKRWYPKYINQSGAKNQQGLLRGLAAWSGYDPLNEERGKTWIEADYGKPLVEGKKDYRLPGLLTKEQMQIELDSGKLPKPGA
ncbi:hypothetical protein AK812_SmicGene21569 [Symbiodinium microadriaticum]|uniref:Uncharacterized protein n=1 Tax=Symbiodinium microadriaticum TaxID=2951 RepID=A0A1Q9DM33_SYMMI|nr:hypothetical protein AK812_SmicGene21569 [Symbiodinium microadriaticum]